MEREKNRLEARERERENIRRERDEMRKEDKLSRQLMEEGFRQRAEKLRLEKLHNFFDAVPQGAGIYRFASVRVYLSAFQLYQFFVLCLCLSFDSFAWESSISVYIAV